MVMKNGSGYVVVLHSAARKVLHRRKYLHEELCRRAIVRSFTNGLQSFHPESFVFGVKGFRYSVG
jgi:hypothetical protein